MPQTSIRTGFMGTGESTVGRLLAERTGQHFIDTDALIEERTGRTIANIFAEQGEAAFRALEREVAVELAGRSGLVIATGGRLMLDETNAAALGEGAAIFCLTAPAEEIVRRVQAEAATRPLLAGVPDPAARVQALLNERAAAYGRFPQVETAGKSPAAVVAEIMRLMNEDNLTRLTVQYPTGQYDVLIGPHLLPQLAELAGLTTPPAIIADSNVGPLYAAQCGPALVVVTIPAGAQHKTLDTVRTIYDPLLAAGLERSGTIVALGGGVVGDVAGFVAATYLRGVRLVQCPTSLLAMVDASVGGKTGVDLPQGKNLVGAFKQPELVLADTATLETLPPAEFSAGLAEVVKSGLIAAPAIVERLEGAAPGQDDLSFLILESIRVKRDVVQEDPFEHGRRAVLNLGHTFGHAIEQVSSYQVRHGEAVAMGLVAAARLSVQLGHCPAGLPGRIETVLQRCRLPTRIPAGLDPAAIQAAMGSDKKRSAGRLSFILLRGVGDVFITNEVPSAAVLEILTSLQAG